MRDTLLDFRKKGYCVLNQQFAQPLITASREAFWPRLRRYLEVHEKEPNRGPHRHYLPIPFEPPSFAPEFFFDGLSIVRGLMDGRACADQWGCDVALQGSEYQGMHVDYRRP